MTGVMKTAATTMAAAALLIGCVGAEAKVHVTVDLGAQRMEVVRGDGEARSWPVSTGRDGFETPRGAYGVTRMDPHHRSREYDNAPMEHAIFFTGGYAIHATPFVGRLGRPASHGCVRLGPREAAELYGWVKAEGGDVTITGSLPVAAVPRFRAVEEAEVPVGSRQAPRDVGYDGPSDDPAPRGWRRARAADGFEGDAPTGW